MEKTAIEHGIITGREDREGLTDPGEEGMDYQTRGPRHWTKGCIWGVHWGVDAPQHIFITIVTTVLQISVP
ncbi:hypothetical protein TNCV_3706381 [Trichonephila clavipes]|nr:hypothetical protein TNCV_3706381 [Trichonephila clavipes]